MPAESYRGQLAALKQAIAVAPGEQLALVQATDEAFEFLEVRGAQFTDEEVLELKLLLAHAQTLIGRYFGT